MTTFVSVGHARHHFSRLLGAVAQNIDQLSQPVWVQHGHTPFSCRRASRVDFVEFGEYQERLSESETVILHGGAVSILQAIKCGKVPIVMPRRPDLGEHVDDHQVCVCRKLAEQGKLALLEDPAALLDTVARARVMQDLASGQVNKSEMFGLVSAAIEAAVKKRI